MNDLRNTEIRLLALVVKSDPERFRNGGDSITLACNGVIISGRPVPRSVFLEAKQNATLKAFEDLTLQSLTKGEIEEDEEQSNLIENIHKLYLTDAQYYIGDKVIPSQAGTSIVVNINSIDAYNFGKLSLG
ncbi:hypothetical protein [Acinetobacter sp. FDAARGOS_515]|uniref:hypothetical protein n=1 Tax=Acinetobacter sp. FDAARGOS_515 TaxID=2420307 RepID=UPI000F670064|nr:hypothetical protein [Acinetobacter sp. FDAARGOS_515]RSC23560.1 hypothetical protein EGS47_12790 [Acinetobacter sp. FDAARGOS_515]